MGLALLLEVCYARLLGPTGRGQISLCLMAIGVSALLGGLGGEIPIMVWAANRQKAGAPWLPAVLLIGATGATSAMATWAATFWLWHPRFLLGISDPLAWLVLALIPAEILCGYGMAWLTGRQRLLQRAVVLLTWQGATLVGALALLLFWRAPEAALLALFGSSMFALLLAWGLGRKEAIHLLRGWRKVRTQLLPTLSLGVRGQLGNLATFFNYRLDVFIVNSILNPAQVGIYAVGVLIAESLWQIADAAAVALVPRAAAAQEHNAAFTCRVTSQVFFLACVSGLVIAVLCPFAVPLVFGAKFAEAVAVVWWLLPGTVSLAGGKVMSAALTARGIPQYSSAFAFVALTITVALDFALIPRLGIQGAAMASSAAYLVDALLVAIVLRRKLGVGWKSLYVPMAIDFDSYRQAWSRALAMVRPSPTA